MEGNNTYHDGMEGLNLPESLRVTPFTTPQNYFEELPKQVIGRMGLVAKVPPEVIPFSIPSDYFSQLTDRITAQASISKAIDQAESWETPTGYFENLGKNIQSRIRVEAIADQEDDFTVPLGYFEQLSEQIAARRFEDKLRESVATDGFAVPEHYFTKLTAQLSAANAQTERTPAPEKAVVRKLNAHRWIQYAAAACVATVLGITSYTAVVDHNTVNATESHLATVPDEEIINYLASSTTSDDLLYIMEYTDASVKESSVCSEVKDNDIEDYLNYML